MAKNWAIAIGINQYHYLQPLKYAKRDAQLIQQFLRTEAGFDQILFFSDDSPDHAGKPIRANLLRVLRQLSETPRLRVGDNFWFFFSGHGMRHAGRDYLMPLDCDPGDIENTAISINHITERLRSCGADNVVLILDACRRLDTRAGEGIGRQTAEEARSTGVISIFSCSPNEYSYEIEALQQGAFTHVLLEGLGIQGQCATVERLNQYLTLRVPEVVRQHKKARQTPYTIAEPITKSHLILVPRYATRADIATLKNDAYRALVEEDIELAEQLWIRALAMASGQDMEAVKALQTIERLRVGRSELKTDLTSQPSCVGGKGEKSSPLLAGEGLEERSTPEIAGSQPDNFSSERGVDYTNLQDSDTRTTSSPNPKNSWSLIGGGVVTILALIGGIYIVPKLQLKDLPQTTNSPAPSSTLQSKDSPKSEQLASRTVFPTKTATTEQQKNPKPEALSDNLPSVRGGEYTRLEALLAARNWKEADQETLAVMHTLWERSQEPTFPCQDLSKINQLWVRASSGRFGFSVQKRIQQEVNETYRAFGERVGWNETYRAFGERVGWDESSESWNWVESPIFSQSAPIGHLPTFTHRTSSQLQFFEFWNSLFSCPGL